MQRSVFYNVNASRQQLFVITDDKFSSEKKIKMKEQNENMYDMLDAQLLFISISESLFGKRAPK